MNKRQRKKTLSKRVRKAMRRHDIAAAAAWIDGDLIGFIVAVKAKSEPQIIFPADVDSHTSEADNGLTG